MTIRTSRRGWAVALLSVAALALSGAAMAENHGGGGGGGGGGHSSGGGGGHSSGGGGGHAASHAGGGFSGGGHPTSHGGYAARAPTYRGGTGYYRAPATVARSYTAPSAHTWGTGYTRPGGNVHSFAPSYGHGPWGRPGWHGRGYGQPFYSYVGVLPAFYSTFWWGGIPYYYGDNSYYLWNEGVGQYQVVPPPAAYDDSGTPAPAPQQEGGAPSANPYVFPNSGQTPEQQQTDRYECHRWAVDQSGFDPTQANGGAQGAAGGGLDGYQRAESACLQGRGYTVR